MIPHVELPDAEAAACFVRRVEVMQRAIHDCPVWSIIRLADGRVAHVIAAVLNDEEDAPPRIAASMVDPAVDLLGAFEHWFPVCVDDVQSVVHAPER